jgi:hypothetical protein
MAENYLAGLPRDFIYFRLLIGFIKQPYFAVHECEQNFLTLKEIKCQHYLESRLMK